MKKQRKQIPPLSPPSGTPMVTAPPAAAPAGAVGLVPSDPIEVEVETDTNITTGHVTLTWTAPWASVPVNTATYHLYQMGTFEIFRDGAPLATVAGTLQTYVDTTAQPEQTYTYTARLIYA